MSMPEANRRNTPNEPIRVYAPSRGNLAMRPEAVPATRVAEPARRPNPTVRPHRKGQEAPARRTLAQLWREYKVAPVLAVFCCIFAAAGALLVMIFLVFRKRRTREEE